MKSQIYNGNFENHHKTINTLSPFLNSERHIFITTAQLLPLFSNQISDDFRNVTKSNEKIIHWYFPVANDASPDFKEFIRNDFSNDRPLMNNSIWGALKKSVSFNQNDQTACLSLKGTRQKVSLRNPKIIFKDRKNIYLIAESVIVAKSCNGV